MFFAKYPQTLAFFVAFVADRGFREFHRVLHPRGSVPWEPQVIAIGGTVEEAWLENSPLIEDFQEVFSLKP